jgi:hypothetical protein
MASTINAITSGGGGIAVGGDTSGVIGLQSNGTTFATGNQYGIGLGTAVPSSGIGIAFPATQSASSDANTLDDYEEGTFTPTLTSGSGSITAYTAKGRYVKIGKSVTITMSFSITTAGTAGGVGNFNGLPFTTVNAGFGGGNRAGVCSFREDAVTGLWYFAYIDGGSTSGTISTSTNGAIGWGNGYVYVTSFVYESAA